MAKAQLKTAPTKVDPITFLEAIEHPQRRIDGLKLLEIFNHVTKLKPQMWGPSIIGYGRYEYRYESGREGEFFLTGFSPRKSNLTIYIMPGYQDLSEYLDRLGKHKTSKSCLYINKLSDIDLDVLAEIIQYDVNYMRENYFTSDC